MEYPLKKLLKLQVLYKYIMKKVFKTILTVILCLVSLFPMKSFATAGEKAECHDINLPESEIQRILELNPENDIATRASDLILTYNVAISKDGSTIKLVAKMFCDENVVKCGFKKILIQKRATTSSSWSTCLTIGENYVDSFSHITSKVISVPSGYQYRAVCTFYAKKSLLSTQKIELNSNYVSFW